MGCCHSNEGQTAWEPFKKKCLTDRCWLGVFVVFLGVMTGICIYAGICGSFSRLVSGHDSFGNICGQNNSKIDGIPLSGRDQTKNKYVFTLDPCNFNIVHRRNKSMALCVSKCPDVELNSPESLKNFAEQNESYLCSYDLSPDQYTTSPDKATKCPKLPVHKSTSWSRLFSHCAPQLVCYTNVLKSFMRDSKDSIFHSLINEFVTNIEIIWGLCLLALVLSYLLAFVFRSLNKCFLWLIIILLICSTVGLTVGAWFVYGFSENALGQNHNLLILAIVVTVFTGILLILMNFVICTTEATENTFKLFALAGKVVTKMCWIPFQFFWTILLIGFFTIWTLVMLFLSTVGDPVKNNETGFVEFHFPAWVKILMFCHTIGLIWITNFILACQQMSTAMAVATYYFTRDQNEISCCSCDTEKNWPICVAICRVVRYHLGTAAIGALIIPMAKIPNLIFLYIRKHLKERNCCSCIEKICLCSPLYLNLNVYTATVINSTNLFESGLDAFKTLGNAKGTASIEHFVDVVVLLGKKLVVFCTAFAGVSTVIIHHKHVIPLSVFIIICLLAFLVVHSILSIFVIVIDVILLCYAYDIRYKKDDYYGDEKIKDFIVGMQSLKNELINLGQLDGTTESS